jgi:hypothetical protein
MTINPVGRGAGSTPQRESRKGRGTRFFVQDIPWQDSHENFMIPFVTQAYGMKMP